MVNKAILIGNIGNKPEIKQVNEKKVANFSLATSEKYKDKSGQQVEQTEWHRVVMWSPLAELAEKYLDKGSKVYIEGKIKTRSYEDKDSVKRSMTEIEAREMKFLSSKPDVAGSSSGYAMPSTDTTTSTGVEQMQGDDDLPF
jgi:single-strand DNA-binding protein